MINHEQLVKAMEAAVHESAQINRVHGAKRPELPRAICRQVVSDTLSAIKDLNLAVVPVEATSDMIVSGIAERHDQPVPEAWSKATQNIYTAMIRTGDIAKGQDDG